MSRPEGASAEGDDEKYGTQASWDFEPPMPGGALTGAEAGPTGQMGVQRVLLRAGCAMDLCGGVRMDADPVERQLVAYNARDIAAFVPCFSASVVIEDGTGTVLMRGHDEVRQRYGAMFSANPLLQCELVHRIRVGSFVIDEERITGRGPEPIRAVAIYRVDDGMIDHVRLLR